MRLLHAGHPDDDESVPRRDAGSGRGADPRGAVRQSVPLHRLSAYRRGHAARRRAAAEDNGRDDAKFRRSDPSQRGRAAAERSGAVRRRCRASRHAVCGLPAQQRRARPHPLDRRFRGARARRRRCGLYRRRSRQRIGLPGPLLVPPPPIKDAIFNQRTQVPLAKDKIASCRRAAGGGVGAKPLSRRGCARRHRRSSSIRCRPSSIWKRR